MLTRRDFLKLAPTAALALALWPRRARAQEPEPPQAWGFPLAFPAYFPEPPPPRRPKRRPRLPEV